MTLLEARGKLEERIKSGKVRPGRLPTALQLAQIETLPELFQHRTPDVRRAALHVTQLTRGPKQGRPLKAVDVYWSGMGWICLDGHHRIAAYTQAKWKGSIPVQVFSGSIDAAMGHAAQNAHARLTMRPDEKLNAAWRLVVGSGLSKLETVRDSDVSDGTVGMMRKVKAALLKKEPWRDLSATTWRDAHREFKGLGAPATEWDRDREEREAQKLADRLMRAAGALPHHLKGSVLARALEIWDRQIPATLMEHWQEQGYFQPPDPNDEPEEF